MPGDSGSSSAWGKKCELAAARKYGLERVGQKWYDAYYPSNGVRVQIKSCRQTLKSGRKGKFRLWERDHKKMLEARGRYVFVLYNPEHKRSIKKIRRVSSARVDKLVNFGPSSHALKNHDRDAKIRWDRIF